MINSTYMVAIQSELGSGENVLWAGQPNSRVIFYKEEIYAIPFSLLWGGFAILWEAGVPSFWSSGHSAPFYLIIGGIPFVVFGQYLIGP